MITSLTRWVLRHRLLVAATWLVLTIGGMAAASSLSGALSDQLSIPGSGVETSARIADRFGSGEREVMALVAEGLSTEEIASRLVISRATAKTHVNRAMFKLGARDRAQLVVIAYRTGLVHPQR